MRRSPLFFFFLLRQALKKEEKLSFPLKISSLLPHFLFCPPTQNKMKKKRFLVVLFWLFTYTFLSFIAFVCSSIHTIWKIVRRKKNFFFSWFPWPLPPPPIDLPLFFSSSHIIPISTCPHPPCHQVIYRHTPHPPLIFFFFFEEQHRNPHNTKNDSDISSTRMDYLNTWNCGGCFFPSFLVVSFERDKERHKRKKNVRDVILPTHSPFWGDLVWIWEKKKVHNYIISGSLGRVSFPSRCWIYFFFSSTF